MQVLIVIHPCCAQALSMGQGQEEAARAMLLDGLQKGHWVMLQNCHLSGLPPLYNTMLSKCEQNSWTSIHQTIYHLLKAGLNPNIDMKKKKHFFLCYVM